MTISLDPTTTALVMIDLQRGILGMDLAPTILPPSSRNPSPWQSAFAKQAALSCPCMWLSEKMGGTHPVG